MSKRTKRLSVILTLFLSVFLFGCNACEACVGCAFDGCWFLLTGEKWQGCQTVDRLANIQQVQSEVSYGYTVTSENSVTKNGEVYSLSGLVNESANEECFGVDWQKTIGTKEYFLANYTKEENDSLEVFYALDIPTMTLEKMYEFENVYDIPYNDKDYSTFAIKPLRFSCRYAGDAFALFQYNGTLQVFSLQEGKMISSVTAYGEDRLKYVKGFNEYGDFVLLDIHNRAISYYEFTGNIFQLHTYALSFVNSDYNVKRIENYVYTQNKHSDLITDAFDLTNDESVEVEVVKSLLTEQEREEKTYNVNGKDYFISYDKENNQLNVLDETKTPIELADITQNQAYIALNGLWDNSTYEKYEFGGFWVVENKLLVGYYQEWGWSGTFETPCYLFEYDIENNKVYYVGFSYDYQVHKIFLHNK